MINKKLKVDIKRKRSEGTKKYDLVFFICLIGALISFIFLIKNVILLKNTRDVLIIFDIIGYTLALTMFVLLMLYFRYKAGCKRVKWVVDRLK